MSALMQIPTTRKWVQSKDTCDTQMNHASAREGVVRFGGEEKKMICFQ